MRARRWPSSGMFCQDFDPNLRIAALVSKVRLGDAPLSFFEIGIECLRQRELLLPWFLRYRVWFVGALLDLALPVLVLVDGSS